MRTASKVVFFLLELAAFAGLAVGGWHVGNTLTGAVLAALLPLAAISVWGVFCAPRSTRRLTTPWRVPLQLSIFLAAAVALGASGHPVPAVLFSVLVVADAVVLTVHRQWDASL